MACSFLQIFLFRFLFPPAQTPQAGLEEDVRRLAELRASHKATTELLHDRHRKERAKLARRWRETDSEQKQEQATALRDLRSKHALDLDELQNGQVSVLLCLSM